MAITIDTYGDPVPASVACGPVGGMNKRDQRHDPWSMSPGNWRTRRKVVNGVERGLTMRAAKGGARIDESASNIVPERTIGQRALKRYKRTGILPYEFR